MRAPFLRAPPTKPTTARRLPVARASPTPRHSLAPARPLPPSHSTTPHPSHRPPSSPPIQTHPTYHVHPIRTDRVREKLVQLQNEVDAGIARAETAEAHGKTLEQTVLERDHEMKSLTVRLEHAEDAPEKSEANFEEASAKMRDLDVKPEEAQRNLHVAEKERDQWKQKYERTTRPPRRGTHRKGGARRTRFADGGPVSADVVFTT
ncbi:hypothetical protein B0H19DRAFT_1082456 [Mycena capillaripes]|nr:hypothetical protein B0H19DRAFT_1082456 [Mycena capillaripes]